jgi:hypothetical protein
MNAQEARDLLQRARNKYVDDAIMESVVNCQKSCEIANDFILPEKREELIVGGYKVTTGDDTTIIVWEE